MPSHASRERGPFRRRRLVAIALPGALVALALAVPAIMAPPRAGAATLANTPHYNLPLALQESLYFYDAEKSGPSRSLNAQPLEWRGDSEPADLKVPLTTMSSGSSGGSTAGTNMSASFISANKAILDPDGDGTVDLSGGFHDAGDHVKFGLPQSYAASVIAWSMYEFGSAFKSGNAWQHGLDEMKWFSDYFLRSLFTNSSGDVVAFAYQVGEGSIDHNYWGPSELQSEKTYPRPAYFATSEAPASDQTAGAAAALAMESMIVKSSDSAYAAKCLSAARALYKFSVAHRGLGYSGGFYGSSFDEDELAWAAATLYLATGTHSYVDDIVSTDSSGAFTGWMKRIIASTGTTWQNIWVMSWDTKWGGVFNVLDPAITGDSAVPARVRELVHYFNKWNIEYWAHVPHDASNDTTFLATTPNGFGYLNGWGSARYNVAAQLQALVYRKNFPDDPKSVQFTDWAMGQMNYLMGDNKLSRSYIVGFGSTTPGVGSLVGGSATAASHPHHADAHGSLTNNQDDPPNDRHILWGALVGGPDADDNHNDITTDFVLNEVAVDYNAALPGALAGLFQWYGQSQTVPTFTPPAEAAESPYFAYGKVNQDSSQATQMTATVNNFATKPPHFQTDMSVRYFFDISSIYAHGQDISAISTPVFYDAAKSIDGQATKISAPVRWGAANSCVYYVSIDWTGDQLSGKREFQFGINAAMASDYKTYWSSAKSPSFTGLAAGTYASTPDPYIPVYLGGTLAYGQEPSLTANETCGGSDGGDTQAPTAPGTLINTNLGQTSIGLSWNASTDNVGVTGYDVYQAQGSGTASLATTVTGTTATISGLTPNTRYSFYVVAHDAAGNVSAQSNTLAVTTLPGGSVSPSASRLSPSPSRVSPSASRVSVSPSRVSLSPSQSGGPGTCRVAYSRNEWTGGFTGSVTITNTGTVAVNGWTLTFTFGGDQAITSAWTASVTQSGKNVTATNLAYNAVIAAGANLSFGFQGTWSTSDAAPTGFALNGTACTAG